MVASTSPELEVCEGVESTWNYHLREKGSPKSLCGARVMQCRVPLSRWGKQIPNYHIPEKYCGTCDEKHEGMK